ncbi:MAG: hypothetical protein HYV63_32815 [Candidatus Schekmanbacteria bacterium]|nr:hypothetical protein [Candidatus Schekmanbacteria bacterium]
MKPSHKKLSSVAVLIVVTVLSARAGAAPRQRLVTPLGALVTDGMDARVGDPAFAAGLLAARSQGASFGDAFSPARLAAAVGDEVTGTAVRASETNRGTMRMRYQTEQGAELRVNREEGRVSYLNAHRAFTADQNENRVSVPAAELALRQAAGRLGVPVAEVSERAISKRLMLANAAKGQAPAPARAIEVFVRLFREIGGVPVLGSKATGAIGADGRIARMHVQWPAFRLSEHVALAGQRSREEMAELVTTALSHRNATRLDRVPSYIAFVKVKHLSGSDLASATARGVNLEAFVPALIVSLLPQESVEDSGAITGAVEQLAFSLFDLEA